MAKGGYRALLEKPAVTATDGKDLLADVVIQMVSYNKRGGSGISEPIHTYPTICASACA